MKIINLHHPLNPTISRPRVVMAMGFFDGVHLGHQKVIKTAKKIAEQKHLPLAVLTYDHHPKIVYQQLNIHDRRYLTLQEPKMALLKRLGVQIVYRVSYTAAFQNQSPQEFVNNYLLGQNVDTAVAGYDHTYGSGHLATMKHLKDYVHGEMAVEIVQPALAEHKKISSTRIRKLLDEGKVTLANRLLNRPFQIRGTVVHGLARGRKLGYPTANVETSIYQWIPQEGVYVVAMQIGEHWYPGMAQIGRNVTFGDHNPVTIEINLLDFDHNIYGEVVNVNWLKYLRGEVKYTTADALIDQLKQDETDTRQYFSKNESFL